MGADADQFAAMRVDAGGAVERAEVLQEFACLRQMARRRRVQKAQIGAAPGRQFQRQRRQIRVDDLGAAFGIQALVRRPQAQRVTGTESTGATGALGR